MGEWQKETMEERKAPRSASLIGAVTKIKDPSEKKAKGKWYRLERNPVLLRLWRARAHGSEVSSQMDQQHRRRR